MLLAVVAAFWPQRGDERRQLVRLLSRITLGVILVDLLMEWSEISVPLWGNVAPHVEGLRIMLFGPFWWVFWIGHLLLGSLVPIYLLVRHPDSPKWAGLAGALAAIFFMAVRLNIVIPGQVASILPGLEGAVRHPRLMTFYVPSLHEWLVLAFVIALGILMFAVAKRRLALLGPASEVIR